MSEQQNVIPVEAVEAAARTWVGRQVWQDCNEAWRADYLERVRAMLEAAAPYLNVHDNEGMKMSDREELIELIWQDAVDDRTKSGKDPKNAPVVRCKVEAVADKIIAAGWRK